ncbi:MAG: hypothetical protein HQ448_04390 [Cytophagales bacterium]|nr:hypothetical protein [Cytophagales bacterium]
MERCSDKALNNRLACRRKLSRAACSNWLKAKEALGLFMPTRIRLRMY